MKQSKKDAKERLIVKAAERIFANVGYKNAKMEDIAAEANITKVTLYSYFKSKDNLYMAVTYAGLNLLIDRYYATIDQYKNESGLECALALINTFMSFGEDNYLYSEALLDYFSFTRSSSQGTDDKRLTDALKDSLYFSKLQDMHNLPFKLTVKEVKRGQLDKSIDPSLDPMVCTLQGWTVCVGYFKVIAANGDNASPLFNVKLNDLKQVHLQLTRSFLVNPVFSS